MKEKLKSLYAEYNAEVSAVRDNFKRAIEDLLRENGFDKDVYHNGRRGRLLVEYDRGSYELRFYAYTKSGELSKMSSGYVWLWSPSRLDEYQKA